MPGSFIEIAQNELKWLRPEEYIKNYLIDREIRQTYPNKNAIKMRIDIKESHSDGFIRTGGFSNEYDYDTASLMSDDTNSRKRNIYKDFFKILDRKLDIKVISSFEREETEEEFKKRKDEELQEKIKLEALNKTSKKTVMSFAANKNKNLKNTPIVEEKKDEEKLKIKEIYPNNMYLEEIRNNDRYNYTTPTFCKWVGSIFQTIKDLEINDANVNYNFFIIYI
jgi:hypothetical protein